MILSPARRFAFVHIPRTGGHAIKDAYRRVALPSDLIDTAALTHATIGEIAVIAAERFGVNILAGGWTIAATTREPRSHAESAWQFLRECDCGDEQLSRWPDWLQGFARSIRESRPYSSAPAWVLGHWSTKPSGWWAHYCLAGEVDRVTWPLRAIHLGADWRDLCAWLEIRPPALPLVNARLARQPAEWTPEAVAILEDRCRAECRRFGYLGHRPRVPAV